MKPGFFDTVIKTLPLEGRLMPVLFIGHGSPMNGIEDNEFSRTWKKMASEIPVPKAVLVISAHWSSRGTQITAMDFPRTIHDFRGFPPELFAVNYPAPGSPLLAREVSHLVHSAQITEDHDWGLDHGAWTIVRHMYPQADIPVLQMSLDYTRPASYHYQLAAELYDLRRKGVLIIGSGNIVHNLRLLSWDMMEGGGYDWALEVNEKFKGLILNNDYQSLINYDRLGKEALLAVPTPEHYLPLLYVMGLKKQADDITIFNDKAIGGSLTMTSVKIG